MSWRSEAALIIGEVIRRVGRQDMTALRKELAEAYPWGARENYPYKVWLAEIRHQLGHPLNRPRADPGNTQLDMFNQN
ncbi:hypothetical protein ALP73_01082 [Pseudomonas coronafaciens pv. garcae]|uniref:Uncharacterized protein n=2 Tax=Pseudomonas syringae group TaxID=136849 RepID=A0A0N0XB59_PSESX|nr:MULTISPECIES: hypothetical protein [Pseudomonas syringae group]KPC30068.1 Uncharacterized protein ABJ99_1447 [Pseudomonas syringae pv. cilantro]KPC55562.1 Uncharacterized protein AC509_1350 [Pseudomonas amygdali pv. morsprunorum]KPW81200.1 Uncharacterized protein ALO76_02741 [Pseudomonas syringae pv. coriandricola]MBN3471680.1 hypothetical protein [Pseudomonas savastanoi pv. phaseolicola]MBN3478643.1 hypothetical protein [Pseudomonas savastanoi pv. phaseolicola]